MVEIRASGERLIAAPADRVYGYLADYREHHPRILPPAFTELRIEAGGVGAGTVFSLRMRVGGRTRASRMQVTEPAPGRVLVESDLGSDLVTTFTVAPEGRASRVRIETRWTAPGGPAGLIERLFAPRVLRRLYADELARLDAYAREQGPG